MKPTSEMSCSFKKVHPPKKKSLSVDFSHALSSLLSVHCVLVIEGLV